MNWNATSLAISGIALCFTLALPPSVLASGSGEDPQPTSQPDDPVSESEWEPEEAPDSAEVAQKHYNDGVKKMESAKEAWQKAKSDKERAKAAKGFDKAAKNFSEALEYRKDYPEALNNLAFSLRVSGRYDEAMTHYNRAIELRPDFMQAHEYRARAYLALDSVAQAQAEHQWLVDHKHQAEADSLKVTIDAWVLAKAEGRKVSAEKLGW